MDSMLIPILVALTVGLLVWVGARVVIGLFDPERKRLQTRLATGTKRDGGGGASHNKAITYATEATGASAVLARWSFFKRIHKVLIQAWPETTLATFLGIATACGVLGALGAAVIGSAIMMIVVGATGVSLPFVVLAAKRARRQRALSSQLPESLDFLSRVLKAGHSFSTGIQMMGDELPKPLSIEFRRAYDQHTLGQSIEDALKDMARRIESTDFAFFVTAVLIQRQTGGDLSEVLKNISGMIRNRVRLQQHVKAKTAEGRLTGYILVAFPLVMFVLLAFMNPRYARTLTGTDAGHKLLATAFGLQMMGLWAIRRITTVKV
ncbi:MAG: type II secretion system F family protein [Tepidisphaeraceae bacterium]